MVAGVASERGRRLSSTGTRRRSAIMPLACSITMRLDRAALSWALSSRGLDGRAVLQDGDGGDVGERLGDDDVVVAQRSGLGAEQVEGADESDRAAASGWRRRRRNPACDGDGGEAGPAPVRRGQVLVDDGLAAVEAVQARPLVRTAARTARRRASLRSTTSSPAAGRRGWPSMMPAAAMSRTSTQRSDSVVSSSTMSKSSTRLSASSTMVRASTDSRVTEASSVERLARRTPRPDTIVERGSASDRWPGTVY